MVINAKVLIHQDMCKDTQNHKSIELFAQNLPQMQKTRLKLGSDCCVCTPVMKQEKIILTDDA